MEKITRQIRFDPEFWVKVEKKAKEEAVTPNSLLKMVMAQYITGKLGYYRDPREEALNILKSMLAEYEEEEDE